MAKSNEKKRDFFWLSYSDLMTSLFFVMLVLFVLVYTMQNKIIGELDKAKQELTVKVIEYERLQQLDKHMNKLKSNPSFVYLPSCKKFVVKDLIGAEIFNPNETNIKQEYVNKALHAGREIEKFLSDLNKDKNLAFLLVIEGNMANFWDKRINPDYDIGYKLSYERALAVYLLWQRNGIDLRRFNTEIIIAGSGFNGLCRETTEENNKRFSIQIIPKIGEK
jgi:outer membrane protein OmpA-like peptidoglycan-associated protein